MNFSSTHFQHKNVKYTKIATNFTYFQVSKVFAMTIQPFKIAALRSLELRSCAMLFKLVFLVLLVMLFIRIECYPISTFVSQGAKFQTSHSVIVFYKTSITPLTFIFLWEIDNLFGFKKIFFKIVGYWNDFSISVGFEFLG